MIANVRLRVPHALLSSFGGGPGYQRSNLCPSKADGYGRDDYYDLGPAATSACAVPGVLIRHTCMSLPDAPDPLAEIDEDA